MSRPVTEVESHQNKCKDNDGTHKVRRGSEHVKSKGSVEPVSLKGRKDKKVSQPIFVYQLCLQAIEICFTNFQKKNGKQQSIVANLFSRRDVSYLLTPIAGRRFAAFC